MSPTATMGLFVVSSPFWGISESVYKLFFSATNEAGFWLVFFIAFLALLFSYPLIVFFRKEDRKKRAIRYAKVLLILLFLTKATAVLQAAIARNSVNPNYCIESISPDKIYSAKSCAIKTNEAGVQHFIVMVYEIKSNFVIAKEEGEDIEVKIWWNADTLNNTKDVVVGGGGGGVIIDLPPSFLTRMMAKLP